MCSNIFRRGRKSAERNIPGKGVGLAGVKSIVETYNGSVRVESTPGVGSTFHNQRRVCACRCGEKAGVRNADNGVVENDLETEEEPRSQSSAEDGSVVILLVDDDADCRLLIRDAISECKVGNKVVEVANGKRGADYLCQRGAWEGALGRG